MKYQHVRYSCAVIELIDKNIANEIVNNLEKRYHSDAEIQNMILKRLLENKSLKESLQYLASLQKHEVFNRFLKYILDKYDFSQIYEEINSSDFKVLSAYFYNNTAVCEKCGKTFVKPNSSARYCSFKCSNSSDEVKRKKEQTCLKHYGTKNHTQSEIYKKDLKKRNQEKYGVNYYTETDDFKNKARQTKFKKYGNEFYINAEKLIQTRLKKSEDPNYNKNINRKRVETCLKKYGESSVLKLDETKQKIKQTKFERYGDANFTNREKFVETCLKKYDVKNVSQSDEVKQKVKLSNLKKFGNECFTKSDYYRQKAKQRKIQKLSMNGKIDISHFKEYLLTYVDEQGIFNMNKMMQDFNFSFSKCCAIKKEYGIFNPNVKGGISKAQIDIFESIKNDSKIMNCRKLIYPYEVDIYIPDHKLAIEYNGIYWHSEIFRDR